MSSYAVDFSLLTGDGRGQGIGVEHVRTGKAPDPERPGGLDVLLVLDELLLEPRVRATIQRYLREGYNRGFQAGVKAAEQRLGRAIF